MVSGRVHVPHFGGGVQGTKKIPKLGGVGCRNSGPAPGFKKSLQAPVVEIPYHPECNPKRNGSQTP